MRLSRFFHLVVLLCLLSISAGAQFSYLPSNDPPVRVRLSAGLQKLQLQGLGFQIHGREAVFEKVAIPQKQIIQIERDQVNGKTIWRIERSGQVILEAEKYLALKAIDIQQGGKALPNQIILAPRGKDSFDVIGVLPLESYLVGVLASEMPLGWPMDTLKAQAIAARSYALATMKERARESYHLESSILDQVFTHISHHLDDSPLIAKAKEAVSATEGMLLQNPSNRVVKAFYHSDCGGKTVSSTQVWGVGQSMGVTVDESCPVNPRAQWKLSLSNQALAEKLKGFMKGVKAGEVLGLRLLKSGPEERVQKVEINFEAAKPILVSANDFRQALGFDQLRSTLFSVSHDKDFVFSGRGFGHGVGLCQWGARALGRQGKTYSEILEHYYPKAQLFIPKLVTRNFPKLEPQTR